MVSRILYCILCCVSITFSASLVVDCKGAMPLIISNKVMRLGESYWFGIARQIAKDRLKITNIRRVSYPILHASFAVIQRLLIIIQVTGPIEVGMSLQYVKKNPEVTIFVIFLKN